jgi:hypothetical protein
MARQRAEGDQVILGSKDRSSRRRKSAKALATINPPQEAAAKALKAIVAHYAWTQSWLAERANHIPGQPTAPDLADVARVIGSDLQRLNLTATQLLTLIAALDAASDRQSANRIREAVLVVVEIQWEEYQSGLCDAAIATLEHTNSRWHSDFDDFLTAWPRLRSDPLLRARAIDVLASDLARVGARLWSLRQLEGDLGDAQRVLCLCMDRNAKDVDPDEVASLVGAWAGHTTWGQLQHRLWWIGAAKRRDVIPLAYVPAPVAEAVQHVEQLRLTAGRRSPELQLADMTPESRAAWRRMLKADVGADSALRDAVAEAVLWYTAPIDDRQAQLAVIELYGAGVRHAMLPFREHQARIVRTRAESVLGLVNGEPDAVDVLAGRSTAGDAATFTPRSAGEIGRPRTWIADARIERLIEAAIDQAARAYAIEFTDTAESGEETHVANLFRDLKHQFQNIDRRIAVLAAESRANERLALRLDYRVVGKKEEGDTGEGSGRFSTDVCLLFQARNAGSPPFARRASLLQAKRLHVRRAATDIEYYPIKPKQLEDIAEQTTSSYILLIGPICDGLALPVIPAKLLLEMIERGHGQPRSVIYPNAVAPIANGLASWMMYDVIGLWTGDWSAPILKRAEGAERRGPFLLVEIIAEILPVGPDGWLR